MSFGSKITKRSEAFLISGRGHVIAPLDVLSENGTLSLVLIIGIFAAAFLTSLITTPYGRKIGIWLKMVDQPGTRKIHKQAAVRSGGIAVAFGIIAGYAVALLLGGDSGLVWWREGLVALSVLIASIGGFRDDVSPIAARTRMGMQVLAGLLLLVSIAQEVSAYSVATGTPEFLIYPACLILVVAVINAVNFIDGIDGLSSTMVLFSGLAIVVVNDGEFSGIEFGALAMAGASLGFLPWNLLGYKSGRVFLGDGGTTLLGALVAALAVRTVLVHPTGGAQGMVQLQDFLCFVGLVGVPLIDEGAIVLRRLLTGWPLARGDQGHLHHLTMIHACNLKKPDRVALVAIALIQVVIVGAAYFAHRNDDLRWWFAGVGIAVPLIVYARFGFFELGVFSRGKRALKEVSKAPRNPITHIQALRVIVALKRVARILGFSYVRISGDAGPISVLHGDESSPPPEDARLYRFPMVPRGLSVVLRLEVYVRRRTLLTNCVRVAMVGPLLAALQRALGALPQASPDRATTRRREADESHSDEKRTAPIFTHDRLPDG